VIRILLLLCGIGLLAAAQPKTISIKVQDKPVLTILEQMADACDAHLQVRHGLSTRLEARVSLTASDIPWGDVVSLLDRQYGITVALDGRILSAMDSGEAWKGKLVMRFYDLRPLLQGISIYPGPDLDIPEPGGLGSRLKPPIADSAPPEIAQFVDIIKRMVTPELWDGTRGISIEEYQGSLMVVHTPEGQLAVEALLRDMQRVACRQFVCRVYALPAATADGPVVTAERWQVIGNGVQPIAAFSTLDGQLNGHFSGRQRIIIADGDVVQKAYYAITNQLSDGLVVEVQPTSTIGGVLADIRFSISAAELAGTSDITTADGQKQLSIDRIRQAIDLAHDTRLIPPGGAALYSFADRRYALVFETLDYVKNPPPKP
jgi:hypothetical protein